MEAKSILDTRSDECYWCGRSGIMELHHIYFGHGRRAVSDRLGFIVYLCPECHRGTYGVHGRDGHIVDKLLKESCQIEWEKTHTREEFIQEVGRSYI